MIAADLPPSCPGTDDAAVAVDPPRELNGISSIFRVNAERGARGTFGAPLRMNRRENVRRPITVS